MSDVISKLFSFVFDGERWVDGKRHLDPHWNLSAFTLLSHSQKNNEEKIELCRKLSFKYRMFVHHKIHTRTCQNPNNFICNIQSQSLLHVRFPSFSTLPQLSHDLPSYTVSKPVATRPPSNFIFATTAFPCYRKTNATTTENFWSNQAKRRDEFTKILIGNIHSTYKHSNKSNTELIYR